MTALGTVLHMVAEQKEEWASLGQISKLPFSNDISHFFSHSIGQSKAPSQPCNGAGKHVLPKVDGALRRGVANILTLIKCITAPT